MTNFIVDANPPAGQPYLGASKSFEWPKGAIEHSVDLALPRGVLIRGKVTEEGSDHPVAGASVVFLAHRAATMSSREGGRTKTLADGSFELAGPPRPGHLAVQGPSEDYVLQEIGNREFFEGQPGGPRCCTPTPSSPATRNRAAPAWKSTSLSAGASP